MSEDQLERILLVEDEPDIQTIAVIALESVGGFTVRVCDSGAQALETAPGFAPQIILLDVMMPGMDGPTTLIELRKIPALQGIPVVFMTAKVQKHEVRQYLDMGAANVIPKPFDPMTLSTAVTAAWKRTKDRDV